MTLEAIEIELRRIRDMPDDKIVVMLTKAGYDAYIEYGHIYYRTPEGGVVAVNDEAMLRILLDRAAPDQ